MFKKLRFIITMFLIYALVVFMTMAPSCPPETNVKKAKKASAEIAIYANSVINITREMYRAQLITPDRTTQIADSAIILAKGGQVFDAAILKLENQYGAGKSIPKNDWKILISLFDAEIVNKFISLLEIMKVIKLSEDLRNTINLIIAAVRIIAQSLSIEKTTMSRINSAQN